MMLSCFIIWNGMEWHGMVWYGMVWYGMAWYGVAWNGMKELYCSDASLGMILSFKKINKGIMQVEQRIYHV